MIQTFWKRVWWFLSKLNIVLPYDPASIPFGIYSKDLKTYVHTKSYKHMSIVALFIIAKTWKQRRCPSVSEWINKLWHIQAMKYYPVLKNELLDHETTWRNIKCILLSERSQCGKATYYMISTI